MTINSSTLCDHCSKIPFEIGFQTLPGDGYDGPFQWSLGTFGQVSKRDCPFCQLLTTICFSRISSWDEAKPPLDAEEITTRWSNGVFDAYVHSGLGDMVCVAGLDHPDASFAAKERLDDWIDFNEIRRWIDHCKKSNHPDCPKGQISSLNFADHWFRLIDVDLFCIIPGPSSCPYVALSYVWGNSSDGRLLLNRGNVSTLERSGSLKDVWSAIPAVIRDAVTATRELGQRYLWVDSLCLVQDSPEELQKSVTFMDKIYLEAEFTIMAASGSDAHAGLPGVRPTKRNPQRLVREIVPGLRMTINHDRDWWLRQSVHSRRGWTMQEEVLSQRLLFFIDNQIFFRCSKDTYSEVMNAPSRPITASNHHFSLFSHILKGEASFRDIDTFVLYYGARKFTFEGDFLRAAQGMLNHYTTLTGKGVLEGLTAPLERSLLFWCHSTPQGTETWKLRRPGFPSYSWTGWRYMAHWDTPIKKAVIGVDYNMKSTLSLGFFRIRP